MTEDLKASGSGDVEISRGIVVNPNRCSGTPTIKGTRFSAFHLANMLMGPNPMDPLTIIENYDFLSYQDISNVRYWMTRWIANDGAAS